MAVLSLNDRAWVVADELVRRGGEVDATVHAVGRARVIDAGVKQRGSLEAGRLLALACLSDLATVGFVPTRVVGVPLPAVVVNVRFPVAACMASQYAGWQINVGKHFAMGSGPMRAAFGKEALYDAIGFRERVTRVVGVLEASALPDEAVITHVAQSCNVAPEFVTLLAARTASLAGGVQVVARTVETAMHKLHELGFDLTRVVAGFGAAPLPPVAGDDMAAIGRTNDAVLYGGEVTLYVTGDDDSLADVGARLPSSASKDYGEPFADVFKRYNHDFYAIDPMLFSPASVCLSNIQTGRTHGFGSVNNDVLAQSFFG